MKYLPFMKLRIGDEFKSLGRKACMRVAPACEGHPIGEVDAIVVKDGDPFDRSLVCNAVLLEDFNEVFPKGALINFRPDEAVLVTDDLYEKRA